MGDDMDWDEIWDGLGNEKNWEAGIYRAQSIAYCWESRISTSTGIGGVIFYFLSRKRPEGPWAFTKYPYPAPDRHRRS